MDDLISRQAAIEALLHNQEVYSNNFGDDAIDKYTVAIIDNDAQTIAQLPSAQPESCEDAVSRQYAIEHYQHVCRRTSCKECPLHIQVTDTLTDCELELFLHNLPSVQSEIRTQMSSANCISRQESIDDAPTVDVVSVVRCKDCKHWNTAVESDKAENGLCYGFKFSLFVTSKDEFCFRGERRSE